MICKIKVLCSNSHGLHVHGHKMSDAWNVFIHYYVGGKLLRHQNHLICHRLAIKGGYTYHIVIPDKFRNSCRRHQCFHGGRLTKCFSIRRMS